MNRSEMIAEIRKMGYNANPLDKVNNGVVFEGIEIEGIVLYPDLTKLSARQIVDMYKRSKGDCPDVGLLTSPEYIRENIRIGFQRDSGGLERNLATRNSEFEDIEQYLYVLVGDEGRYKLPKDMATDDLWDVAKRNTCDDIVIGSLGEYLGFSEDGFPIHFVSNRKTLFGAACVLNKEAIREAELGHKFFMIPSSVHEVILIPFNLGESVIGLAEIIREVNSTTVLPEDQLGDRAYVLEV